MDFGITPRQLADIVALWRRCGDQITDPPVRLGELPAVGVAFPALAACGRTTREAVAARSDQLDALADALARFGALTEAADDAAATALAGRRS